MPPTKRDTFPVCTRVGGCNPETGKGHDLGSLQSPGGLAPIWMCEELRWGRAGLTEPQFYSIGGQGWAN